MWFCTGFVVLNFSFNFYHQRDWELPAIQPWDTTNRWTMHINALISTYYFQSFVRTGDVRSHCRSSDALQVHALNGWVKQMWMIDVWSSAASHGQAASFFTFTNQTFRAAEFAFLCPIVNIWSFMSVHIRFQQLLTFGWPKCSVWRFVQTSRATPSRLDGLFGRYKKQGTKW